MPRFLAPLGLVLLASTALSCGVTPPQATVDGAPSGAASGTPVAALGQTITLTGGLGDNEVSVTASKVTTYPKAPDATWIVPERGVYVAVAIEVRVVKGKTYACHCDFALVAADGSLFEPVWGVGFAQAFRSVTLNTGERTTGLVVFDVPASATAGARVQLRPDWANDVRGSWTV